MTAQNKAMLSVTVSFRVHGFLPQLSRRMNFIPKVFRVWRNRGISALICLACFYARPAGAVILWNDPGTTLVHENGSGSDILGGAVKRDDSANDTLYFKFHVEPLSDKDTEEYFAGFELFEGDAERLGIGNSLKAWAYSAFFRADQNSAKVQNNPAGWHYIDLASPPSRSRPLRLPIEYPQARRRGHDCVQNPICSGGG